MVYSKCALFEKRHLVFIIIGEFNSVVEVVENWGLTFTIIVFKLLFQFGNFIYQLLVGGFEVKNFIAVTTTLLQFLLEAGDFVVFAVLEFLEFIDFGN